MEIIVKEAIIKKQCEKLDLRINQITSVGASIIAKALNNNTVLKNLNFDEDRFGDMGVHAITKTLSLNNCKVCLLDLQSTGITDKGAEYLAEMLKANTTLIGLLLGNNEISDRGVQYLTNALTHRNTTLCSLYINDNKLISDASVNSLVEMLNHNPTLTCLRIDVCNLSEKGKEKLRQIAKSKKGFELEV